MKFETPIAEIQKFDLKDVISASGETGEETTPTQTYGERTDTYSEGHCVGGAPDNYQTNCL